MFQYSAQRLLLPRTAVYQSSILSECSSKQRTHADQGHMNIASSCRWQPSCRSAGASFAVGASLSSVVASGASVSIAGGSSSDRAGGDGRGVAGAGGLMSGLRCRHTSPDGSGWQGEAAAAASSRLTRRHTSPDGGRGLQGVAETAARSAKLPLGGRGWQCSERGGSVIGWQGSCRGRPGGTAPATSPQLSTIGNGPLMPGQQRVATRALQTSSVLAVWPVWVSVTSGGTNGAATSFQFWWGAHEDDALGPRRGSRTGSL